MHFYRREDSWIGSPTPEIQVEEAPPVPKEETPETPTAPKRKSNMAKAKEQWGSDEPDEDILDRFLKVKKFQESQAPSYESDGIPSIADIDEERTTSTDKNVRRSEFSIFCLSFKKKAYESFLKWTNTRSTTKI